jgi:AsmA-like C-terminal region
MRRVLLTILTLLAATLLSASWYAYDKGFTSKWRGIVTNEFRKRGLEVSLRRLTLDPLRGLVAKEVRVYETKERRRTIAFIDEMVLQVNYANLVRGKPFLDALDLRDANLSLQIDPAKSRGPRIEVAKLNARLFLPPQQIYLASAEAEVFGVRVHAAGRLINPQTFRPKPGEKGVPPLALFERIAGEIAALKFEAEPPLVSLTFSGDLAQPDKVSVAVAMWGEKIRRKNYLLQSLYLAADFRDGALDLKELTARDAGGELRLTGFIEPAAKSAQLRLRSTLDTPALLRAFEVFPALDEAVFYTSPTLEARAEVSFGETPSVQVVGRLALGKFAWKSVIFESASADFSSDGARWTVRDVRVAHRTGAVSGDVQQLPGDFRARLQSTINPKALRPLLAGQAAETLAQFEFPQSPQLAFEAHGTAPTLDAIVVHGQAKLGPASFRGVAAESASATVHYENRVLSLAPFRVQRTEGGGGGGLYFDFRREEVRFDKIRASMNPREVMLWIEPKLVNDVLPYRFPKQPPNLFIDGLVHAKGGKTTRLAIDVKAPAGMEYTFLKKNLSFPQLTGKLLFTPDHLRISDLDAALFGGAMRGDAEISLVQNRPSQSAHLALESVDFSSLTKLFFNYDNSRGRLNLTCDFTGRGEDARSMEGRGDVAVTEGNVFAIPFLGPLSGVLNGIVPGMGHDVARKGMSTFVIKDGVISTEDLVVQGKGFSMLGRGKLFFIDDKMDFNMRINAQGLPGVLLFPVSKLFEYTADDKLSKPVWRAKMVPKL